MFIVLLNCSQDIEQQLQHTTVLIYFCWTMFLIIFVCKDLLWSVQLRQLTTGNYTYMFMYMYVYCLEKCCNDVSACPGFRV